MHRLKDLIKAGFVFDILILLGLSVYFFVFWEKDISLGGGENYTFLARDLTPYLWDSSANFGRLNTNIVNLLIALLKNTPLDIYISQIFMVFFYFAPYISMRLLLGSLLNISRTGIYLSAALYALNPFRVLYPISVPYVMFYAALPIIFHLSVGIIYRKIHFYYLLLFLVFNLLTPVSSNIALYTLCYLVFPFVYITHLLTVSRLEIKFIIYYLVLMVLIFLINSYWIYLVVDSLFVSFRATNNGLQMFSSLGSGYYFDFFRMLGSWSWYSGHNGQPYYLASSYYQLPLVIIASYSVVFMGFLAYPLFKSIKKLRLIRANLSVLVYLIPLIGMFLVLGTKAPFGFLYDLFYNNTVFLKPYREPFTKFMALYSLGFTLIFALSVQYLLLRFRKRKTLVFLITALLVFVYVAPVLDVKALLNYDRWNAGQWGSVVKVPEYWEEFISEASTKEHYLLLPSRGYGNSYNWLQGANMVWPYPEIATNLQVLRKTDTLSTEGDAVVNALYRNKVDNIGFFNVLHILYQSDFEFRYSNPENIESDTKRILGECSHKYGKFDQTYLEKVLNKDTDSSVRNELYVKLLNQPALCVFTVNEDEYLPKFYIPKNIVYGTGRNEDVVYMRDVYFPDVRTVYKINQAEVYSSQDNYCPVISYGQINDEEPEINLESLTWNKGWVWPKVEKQPRTFRHDIMLLSEKIRLVSAPDKLVRTDYEIWNSSKRIQEILEYNLTGDDRVKNIIRFNNGIRFAFNTLRTSLDEHSASVNLNPKISPDTYWGLVKKLYAYAGVSINLLSSRSEIPYTEVSDSISLFEEIKQWIGGVSEQAGCEYVFNIPKEGNYELFTEESGSWRKLRTDIYDTTSTIELKCADFTQSDNRELIKTSQLDVNDIAKFQQVNDWETSTEYTVSFDYLSSMVNVEVGVYEDTLDYSLVDRGTGVIDWDLIGKGEFPVQRRKIFNEEIFGFAYCVDQSQPCYSHFQKTFTSSSESENGYVFIKTPVEAKEHKSDVLIKNLSVKKRSIPPVAYIQEGGCINRAVPKISYTRVNPTKYVVNVSGATSTFDLVFQENFHSGWRLYSAEGMDRKNQSGVLYSTLTKISKAFFDIFNQSERHQFGSKSYFNGDIVERSSNDVLFDENTIDTWSKQAMFPKTHYIANGFANAWVVDPSVVGREDFTLIIEFWPQRIFYVCSLATVTLILTAILFIVTVLIRKHEKKHN